MLVCVGLSVLAVVAGSGRRRTQPWLQSAVCNSRVPTVSSAVVVVGGFFAVVAWVVVAVLAAVGCLVFACASVLLLLLLVFVLPFLSA